MQKNFEWVLLGKLFKSEIDNVSVSGFAADAGIFFKGPFGEQFEHALVVRNVGGSVSFFTQEDDLPLSIVLGNSLSPRKIFACFS